jgi:RNA polymerase sigma-70 factor (ECF subfamily)
MMDFMCPPESLQGSPEFHTTRWSLILAAGGDGEVARVSLEELCFAYWYPLYAFARRKGLRQEDSEDAVQGFYGRILERGDLDTLDPERGRFRSWLRVSFKNYLTNQAEAARASKRGGGKSPISLAGMGEEFDWEVADVRFASDRSVELTPEQAFERAWAMEVLQRARESVRERYQKRGRSDVFEALSPLLTPGKDNESHASIADRLEESVGAVKVAAHRLRRQFRDALEAEIAETVQGEGEVALELGELFESLGRPAPPPSGETG